MKHKFANKKTGAEAKVLAMYLDSDGVIQIDGYDAVEDLMEDYAAYEKHDSPKEPLIKDEKIRKAVRAWAEANGIEACLYDADDFSFDTDGFRIDFNTGFDGKTKIYTIAELCGEEEEEE